MIVYAVLLRNAGQDGAQLLQAHIDYLTDLRGQGVVLANGRLLNGWGGIVLYRAASLEEARALVERDPFVQHGIRSYELFEWDVKWSAAVSIES